MKKTPKDKLPRNYTADALRKRRAGTGGSGIMKPRNTIRGGQRNEQRDLLDQYEQEKAEALKNDPDLTEEEYDRFWLEWISDGYGDN